VGLSEVNQEGDELKMVTQSRLVTVKELSNYLRVHPSTIYRLLKRGDFPGFKLGSDWRFSLEAIDHWRVNQAEDLAELFPHDLHDLN
jgi:excisionase family DNA binding protein